jgi:hypothetical protein
MGWDISEMARGDERVVEKDMQERYSKFGFDISKATRSLTDLTDEESMKVGELFDLKHSPWTVQRGIDDEHMPYIRDSKGIKLLSYPFRVTMLELDGSRHPWVIRNKILLFSTGMINQQCFAKPKDYENVRKYLCSIGIRVFDLYQERHERYLEERRTEIKSSFS